MLNSAVETAQQRIKTLLNEVERIQQNLDDPDNPLNGVSVDDDELTSRLMVVALLRPLTVADILKAQSDIRVAFVAFMKKLVERDGRCLAKSDTLALYRVTHTANRSIDVLAASVDCARLFAHRYGHVQNEKNARVGQYTKEYVHSLRTSGSAVGRAMREGVPGVLEKIGSGVVIKQAGKVYVPMSVVKA